MNEQYRCGDHEALIAYVYGEDESVGHDVVGAHLAACASCAEDVASLRATRQALAAWAPPEAALGFRVTRMPEPGPAPVLRPAAWWRRPLPAWAQAAAAVLIFAAGVAFGGAGRQAPPAVADTSDSAAAAPVAVTSAPAVSPDDLAALDARLRAVEEARPLPVAAPAAVDETAMMARVQALIQASEQRQRLENARLVAAVDAVAKNIEVQRRADLQRVERRLGQLYTPAEQVLRQHGEAINMMLVSYPQVTGGR